MAGNLLLEVTMGHMSNMAALCRFVASHGLVAEEESAEERAARIEREKKEAEEKKARQEEYDSYCKFWEDKYAQISDSSAIMNLEYALNEVFVWACKMRFPEHFADSKVNLRYPAAHCKADVALCVVAHIHGRRHADPLARTQRTRSQGAPTTVRGGKHARQLFRNRQRQFVAGQHRVCIVTHAHTTS